MTSTSHTPQTSLRVLSKWVNKQPNSASVLELQYTKKYNFLPINSQNWPGSQWNLAITLKFSIVVATVVGACACVCMHTVKAGEGWLHVCACTHLRGRVPCMCMHSHVFVCSHVCINSVFLLEKQSIKHWQNQKARQQVKQNSRSPREILTTLVVPSPTSWSCRSASSTNTLAAGCSTSSSFRMVAPSLVMVTSWTTQHKHLYHTIHSRNP